MPRSRNTAVILMAEDDPDDRLLAEEAWQEARIDNPLVFVEHGEEVLSYLRREGRYASLAEQPMPALILLDLNMPRLDGRGVLKELKEDPALRSIPVVVLTTSQTEEDILRTYDLGVSSFVTKPVNFEALVKVLSAIGRYWLEIVELPQT